MITQIPCPSCEGLVEFEVERHGEKAQCPHCSNEMTLEAPSAIRAAAHDEIKAKFRRRFRTAVKWGLAGILGFSVLSGLAYAWYALGKVPSADLASFALMFIEGLVGAGVFAFALILAALWITFPLFVYRYLRRIIHLLERGQWRR